MTDATDTNMRARLEALGPAEKTIQTLLTFTDHMVHNRPGIVRSDASSPTGVRWSPVTWRLAGDGTGVKHVFELLGGKAKGKGGGGGNKQRRIGSLRADGKVVDANGVIGEYRAPGLYVEVAVWLYRRVAEIWQLDNEFAARWASWAFPADHRDLKVVLAALMLVQDRAGQPVREDGDSGDILFHDDDFRAVGEAMCLHRRAKGKDLNPKLLLRVGDLLALPEIAAVNRELGFGRSARNPAMGRYDKAITKWLRHRERNLPMLQGLVKAGYRQTVMKLARRVGYKPESQRFFEILRWRQKQSGDGRRELAIGLEIAAGESWASMSEAEICERIIDTAPNYKRIVGLLPAEIGLTRAIMAAAIEAGSLSDADLVILTPTLEDLGLLDVEAIAQRWMRASEAAENQRAANIAKRVKRADIAEVLDKAADSALKKAVEAELRGLHVYVGVDISASMHGAIDAAKELLARFLQGFPLDKLTVCVFNTSARQVRIKHASAKGVEHAFKGFRAGGGTSYGSSVRGCFANHRPAADEDALMLFIGDQEEGGNFADVIRDTDMVPAAFAMLHIGRDNDYNRVVERTAAELAVPCFRIGPETFADAYAVPRTLRNLIASTPVNKAKGRKSLVSTILETELLALPTWA